MSVPSLVLLHSHGDFSVPLDASPAKIATLDETSLVVLRIENVEQGSSYRLSIGTSSLGERQSETMDGPDFIEWAEAPYLESARGETLILVESRADMAEWVLRGGMLVDVVPAKLGERRYQAMFEELRNVSPALVYDVTGKSGRASGVAAGTLVKSWQVSKRLVDRVTRANTFEFPARGFARRDARRVAVLRENLDPAEQRTVRQLSQLFIALEQKLGRIATDAGAAAEDIRQSAVQLRTSSRITSLHTLLEAPRLSPVMQAHDAARTVLLDVRRMRTNEPFSRARPLEFDATPFALPGAGEQAVNAVRRTLVIARTAGTGGNYIRPTSRIYEQWVFLRLAGAFAAASESDAPLVDLLRSIRRRGFGGLPRGTALAFTARGGRRITIRYEPIVRPRAMAGLGDEFVRAHQMSGAPLMPDVVVTIEDGRSRRTIVIDAKYTTAPRGETWASVEHYFAIRWARTGRSAVDQVWVAAPVPTGPDASLHRGAPPPEDWRGGLLPLVPGSASPHAWIPAGSEPHRFDAKPAPPEDADEFGEADGVTVALRAFVDSLLFG